MITYRRHCPSRAARERHTCAACRREEARATRRHSQPDSSCNVGVLLFPKRHPSARPDCPSSDRAAPIGGCRRRWHGRLVWWGHGQPQRLWWPIPVVGAPNRIQSVNRRSYLDCPHDRLLLLEDMVDGAAGDPQRRPLLLDARRRRELIFTDRDDSVDAHVQVARLDGGEPVPTERPVLCRPRLRTSCT